ncbi:RDD family protein [Roseateles toxinivorans]|uniref:Putative RDD family membrane protein YckC n=1 Tax=Roseateles toxinivorans TaxID=270368 RepID=A0A4V3CSQ5_9BURK|nr:RDD family protein [Roseateles toxinivorans]TDP61601.1 putative RDD family membrane protein YckC [Roseateles toxinivorans]
MAKPIAFGIVMDAEDDDMQTRPPPFQAPPPASRPAPPARQPAGMAARLCAFLLDALLMLALSAPLMWLAYREPIARLDDVRPLSMAINWLLPGLICILFWCWQGATPGKLLAGIRVIDMRTGARPGLWQSLLRWLGYFVSALPLGLGLLWAAIDPDKRAWHDRLAGTQVVRRRPRNNDEPGYFAAHWRGEQSLVQSFWLNNMLLSVPLAFALTGLMTWISMKGEALQAGSIAMLIGWPLMLIVDVWCIVGAWRAAAAYRRIGGSALWANLARLCLALGALQTLASALIGFAPQSGEFLQMARGIDPIGQAVLKLSDDGRTLRLEGPIGMGDATRLQRLLTTAPQPVRLVELASPGGRVHEAERMVALVRKVGADTRAVGGCESACTLVFLAGTQRQLMPGAQLGFHRASSGTYNPVFDEVANQHLAGTYRDMGLPESFISRTLRTPAHSMWYPASEELASHALIAALPQTLDVTLPDGDSVSTIDFKEALRGNPAWYRLEMRYPGLLTTAAARMQQARAAGGGEAAQQGAALEVLAGHMPELLLGGPPELRHRYLLVLKAQLQAAQTGGGGLCQALLAGQLNQRRHLPVELQARETAWLIAAADAPAMRRLPAPPSALELEVVRRDLSVPVPGLLQGVWAPASAQAPRPCEQVIRALNEVAALPAAQRELAQRLMFQRLEAPRLQS